MLVFIEAEGDRMSRVAVITGASRGIGAATAQELAGRGYRVVVNHRDSAPQAQEVVAAISAAGGEAVAIRADVTSPDDVTALFDETERRWGRVDVLVHNALIPFDVTSFADLSWEQLGGKLDRELHAAFLITKAVVPGMISRNYGRLVYISTGLSRRPRDGMIALGTAKAALDQFVRYVALELAPHVDHRQPRRARHGRRNEGDPKVDGRAVATPRGNQPDGAPRSCRRGRLHGGLPGK
jgi:3-oxoacyl-[acyl-carrier protein] reductase